MMLSRIALAFVLLTGCGPKATTHLIEVPEAPRPFVEIGPNARDVLVQIAADKMLGPEWFVRLEVVWKPETQIEVNLERHKPGSKDFVVDADGLHVAMPQEQTPYLKGALISMQEFKEGAAFDVTFPNRDARDRQLASEWLKSENAKRKAQDERAPPSRNGGK